METKGRGGRRTTALAELPVIQDKKFCDFNGYDADTLMKETAKLRKLITKRGKEKRKT